MDLTKVQISELIRKHAEREHSLHDLLEIMLESMMVAERSEFLRDKPTNKYNSIGKRSLNNIQLKINLKEAFQ